MIPWAATRVTPETLELFHRIEKLIREIPDIDLGTYGDGTEVDVSCHMLARACATIFPVECVDGFYANRGMSHSWLVPKRNNPDRKRVIIDVYPVMQVGGPIMLVHGGITWLKRAYKKDLLASLDNPDYVRKTDKVIEVARKTAKDLGML